jgi:hypothetical protein
MVVDKKDDDTQKAVRAAVFEMWRKKNEKEMEGVPKLPDNAKEFEQSE